MDDLSRKCPYPPNEPCDKVKELQNRIAELESQVVRMQYHDDVVMQKRVFEIRYNDMLSPEEAMEIFVRNIQRAFGRCENDKRNRRKSNDNQ